MESKFYRDNVLLAALGTWIMKNNLRVQRAIKNITQAELADMIQVSRQTINTIESGKYVPSTVLSLKMAKVFEVPVEEIFMLEEGD